MKAVVQRETGAPGVLDVEEVEEPAMLAGDVLIRVHACGVCYHDAVVRSGVFRRHVHMPLIPGHEVAGVVEKVGPAVRNLRVGDRVCTVQRRYVCGQCRECRSGNEASCPNKLFMGDAYLNGGYAEQVAVDESCTALIPASVPMEQAAITACAVGVQLNAIRDVGKLRLGESVLVTGASGGQGVHGVQIARACGAYIVAVTSSQAKAELLRGMGADEVVVTPHGADFSGGVLAATAGRGVDVVIDNVGAQVFDFVRRSCARHARWVLVGELSGAKASFNAAQLFLHDISMLSTTSCSRRHLEDALMLVQRGLVKPVVTRTLPLEGAADAHAALDAAAVTGRIVLLPQGAPELSG